MLKMVLVAKTKRPATIHHKRRSGQHHKQSNHYTKSYWPYLPLTLIVALGLTLSSLWGHANKSVLGYATDMSVSALLSETNAQRQGNSLGALALNSQLANAAQAKANDMAARNYWSHNTPGGQTPWTFMTAAGYNYKTAGENLAYGFDSSSDTVDGWMGSPEHQANILNNTYLDVGFGVANAADYQNNGPQTIVVAMYASPQPVASAPAQPALTGPVSSTPTSQPALSTPPAETPQPENTTTSPSAGVQSKPTQAAAPISTKNVSRIQLVTGDNAAWSMFGISTLATICIAIFLLRHALFWHRMLVKSEAFVIKHKMLDVILVTTAVAGIVLTRTAGLIR